MRRSLLVLEKPRDILAVFLHHHVRRLIAHGNFIRAPTEQAGVELFRAVAVACRQLDPAEVTLREARFFHGPTLYTRPARRASYEAESNCEAACNGDAGP